VTSDDSTDSLSAQTSELLLGGRDVRSEARLFELYGPRLLTLLRGRLPPAARSVTDTVDLVQDVWTKALHRLPEFEGQRAGAFWAFLRRIATNHLIDTFRKAGARGPSAALPDATVDEFSACGESPSHELLAYEAGVNFDRALEALSLREREALLLHFELHRPWDEIALDVGYPSGDAARKAVKRAAHKLIEHLGHDLPHLDE
jgi:RNA polymerase sigma-70 factor (ECF subfamily)